MSEKADYYAVLGVARDADADTIKKAYRSSALKHHPDRNPGDGEAEAKFKLASEAYSVLSDPEKRSAYDRFGHAGIGGRGFSGFSDLGDIFANFGDLFGDIFGGAFGGRGRGGGQSRGNDLQLDLALSFKEAAKGCEKEVRVERHVRCEPCGGLGAQKGSGSTRCPTCDGRGQVMHRQGFFMIGTTCPSCRGEGSVLKDPCPACKGSGLAVREETLAVTVPAGVDDGTTLRLGGRGEPGPRGAAAGNLYVVLHVKEDAQFQRSGADLLVEHTISFAQAALGAEIAVIGVDGDLKVDVEPGTQPGTVLSLRGKGLPRLGRSGAGDLHIRIQVEVPRKLSPRQEELLREFATAEGEPVLGFVRDLLGRKKKRG